MKKNGFWTIFSQKCSKVMMSKYEPLRNSISQ